MSTVPVAHPPTHGGVPRSATGLGAGRITRADLLRLGQASRPWEFTPLAMAGLRQVPQDGLLRFLLGANLARLGLRTAAAEQLALLPECAGAPPAEAVDALSAAISALPDDRYGHAIQTCRANVEALAARGIDLEPEFERWSIAQAGTQWFRTLDGNIVRRREQTWLGLLNHRAAAASFCLEHLSAREPHELYLLEGLDPPWLLAEIAARTPPAASGFQPMLCLVQSDPLELLDGLAQADLRPILRESRLRLFLGPCADEDLEAFLRARLTAALAGPCITLPSTRRRSERSPEAVLLSVRADQIAEHHRLAAEVAGISQQRDTAWWRSRFEAALAPGSPEPLRILIPTTRHSTFIQHSSRDLAEAFRAAGHLVEIIIEPDENAQHSSLAYLRPLSAFRPDLVILINCFRSHLGSWFPSLPFVTWIQDAMAHQFSADAAARRGPLDFMVGHLHPELFSRFGFSRERTLSFPVVTSQTKFHAAPVPPALRGRMECEVAFVSHHAETPEQMHTRLAAEADRVSASIMQRLRPEIERIATDAMGGDQCRRLEDATAAAIRAQTGQPASPASVTLLVRQYALPLAERILRHQTLHWAADIAERRSWRLRLFGRGWEAHPRFGAFAGGALDHGEELRACYQSAAAHLHISITAPIHQRVMECALSGGLPLCRLTSGALDTAISAARRDVWLTSGPDLRDGDGPGFTVADHPQLMALVALHQRLGIPHAPVHRSPPADLARLRADGPTPPERRPDWVLVDLAQTTFRSPAELGALLARAIEEPAWRSALSSAIASRTRQRLTHTVLAERMLRLVTATLREP